MIQLNGCEIKVTHFPDGQPHVELNDFEYICMGWKGKIVASLTSVTDFMGLLLLSDILTARGAVIQELVIVYLLGARMDRRMSVHGPFTLRVVMQMLRTIPCERFTVLEPHSDVVGALAPPVFMNLCWATLLYLNQDLLPDVDYLVSPDAGMSKKIADYRILGQRPVVECRKVRDLETGQILRSEVLLQDICIAGKSLMVVDDICDGGRTFLNIGRELKAANAGHLTLAVCHGIFSQGMEDLLNVYDRIITTNSYTYHLSGMAPSPRVKVIDVFKCPLWYDGTPTPNSYKEEKTS